MPDLFEWLSVVLPLINAVDTLCEIMLPATDLSVFWPDLAAFAKFQERSWQQQLLR